MKYNIEIIESLISVCKELILCESNDHPIIKFFWKYNYIQLKFNNKKEIFLNQHNEICSTFNSNNIIILIFCLYIIIMIKSNDCISYDLNKFYKIIKYYNKKNHTNNNNCIKLARDHVIESRLLNSLLSNNTILFLQNIDNTIIDLLSKKFHILRLDLDKTNIYSIICISHDCDPNSSKIKSYIYSPEHEEYYIKLVSCMYLLTNREAFLSCISSKKISNLSQEMNNMKFLL